MEKRTRFVERVNNMEWFKKLFSFINKDERPEADDDSQSSSVSLNTNKDIQMKVTYQYPKGQFRFPIKIDEEDSTTPIHVQRGSRRTKVNRTHEEEMPYRTSQEKTEIKRVRPYQFEDVPSPVYGFTRKQRKRLYKDVDQNPVEGSVKHCDEFTSNKMEPVNLHKIENTLQEPTVFNEIEDVTQKPIDVNEHSVHDKDTNLAMPDHEHVIKTEEYKVETKEVTSSKPLSEQKTIPFNVVMLSSDKNRMKERHTQPKEEETKSLRSETKTGNYTFPPINLLKPPVQQITNKEWMYKQSQLLDETLKNFNVRAKVVNATQGPSVTRFEISPEPGVKVNKITNLSDDLKLSLAAKDIRMEAPIPGKHTIGIEVPNLHRRPVYISEIISSDAFIQKQSPLTVVLGLDISGNPIVTDLKSMPHGLIAGATGSGKSVCINSIIISLLYKASPDELKLLLIDPKMVELAPYNHIPHLVSPVITDAKAATASLKWAVDEMERRYELFARAGVRDINRYNELAKQHNQAENHLPYIVVIIDELADLMMVAPGDVEEAICRIAQKARACGIHLIVATQRPSVDVITGLIKANVPTRIAFSVSSQVDSRTIIDVSGAEKLLGRGDMLFLGNGTSKVQRLQGTFVTDEEIDAIVDHVRQQQKPVYLFEQEELLKKAEIQDDDDELFYEACEFVVNQGVASTSSLQRRFRIGYNRAARLIELMEMQGIISESKGSKPREVLINEEDLEILQ